MNDSLNDFDKQRRGFIRNVAGFTAVIQLHTIATAPFPEAAAAELSAAGDPAETPPRAVLPDGYQFFSTGEAAFIEALVNTMCPADSLTADGVTCGLATFMDRQLAGEFGKAERVYMEGPWHAGKPEQGYQLLFDPAE